MKLEWMSELPQVTALAHLNQTKKYIPPGTDVLCWNEDEGYFVASSGPKGYWHLNGTTIGHAALERDFQAFAILPQWDKNPMTIS